jgi:23S rRNA (adenine1618-N6)-methyltransferase
MKKPLIIANEEKTRLHPRNKNRNRYDLSALVTLNPELKKYIIPNKYGGMSIEFSNPIAVRILNMSLLNHYYGIKNWDFPKNNLCPPIPGRADYIHHIADLLAENNFGKIPKGDKITCLDIGMGASCIYPIIGTKEYDWKFIASDIDPKSIDSARKIIESNDILKNKIECRLQKNKNSIFKNILEKEDKIDLVICNPPFHSSKEDAQKSTLRKLRNLSDKKVKKNHVKFAGVNNEIIFEGGEIKFIENIINESKLYAKNCYWFSTLVSKQSNLKKTYKLIDRTGAYFVNTIPVGAGNKSRRLVAWTFQSKDAQNKWREERWQ